MMDSLGEMKSAPTKRTKPKTTYSHCDTDPRHNDDLLVPSRSKKLSVFAAIVL